MPPDIAAQVRRFGREIRLRRIALDMRIIDLASLAGLTPSYLGRVETGSCGTNPSLGVAMCIARGMNTNIQDLLGGWMGLTALGLEAGRICDRLPESVQGAALELLRALERGESR